MPAFCGACGSPTTRPDQRFCVTCGTSFDAPPPQDQPTPAPAAAGRSGPSMRTLLLVGGLCLALVAGGFVAWRLMRSEGGSSTPEEAVEAFLQAGASQDVVKMLTSVNPAEARGFTEAYEALRERADDEDMVTGPGITAAFDLELADLEFDVKEQTDDFALVTLEGGTYDLSYDPDEVPSRFSAVAREHPDALNWSGDLLETDSDGWPYWLGVAPVPWWAPTSPWSDEERVRTTVRPSLDVVRVDGRWYVSLMRTMLYAAPVPQIAGNWTNESPQPDWDAPSDDVEPIVGETPEEVVANLLAAVNAQDAEEVLRNFPPDEVMALRPFIAAVDSGVRDADEELNLTLDDLELETEERGDLAIVTMTSGWLAVEHDGDYDELAYTDRCLINDDFTEGCLHDEEAVAWLDDPFVVMIKTSGGYQLSLSATLAEYATQFATNLPRSFIDDVAEELCYEADTSC